MAGAGRGWFPELADARLRQVTWPEIGKHHEFITGQLQAGVTVKTIHQRLVGGHQLACTAPKCHMVSDLLVHGFDYAARWYWLITPPGTFRRRTGALSGTTAGSSQPVGCQKSA